MANFRYICQLNLDLHQNNNTSNQVNFVLEIPQCWKHLKNKSMQFILLIL